MLDVERWTFPDLPSMELRSSLSFAALIALLCGTWPSVALSEPTASPSQRHVVVVVWDGMRPDFVTERNAPTLWKFAREGVTFRRHHSVYPTMTNVNGAAIATGAYPNRNGLLANREYRPRIDLKKEFDTCHAQAIRKGDETSGGKYLALPTVAEIVRATGRRAVITGTKSVALLHDRHAEWTNAVSQDSFTKFAAAPMPPSVREEALRLLGPLPTQPSSTSTQRNAYATRALTDILWRDGVPAYSLLWLNDPDLTQHEYSPGAEPSLAAIRNSDRNFAAVLEALSKKGARETTDLLVVSDHGFSTVERGIDFTGKLRGAGFDAVAALDQTPKAGQVLAVGNEGTVLFYVVERDPGVVSRLIEWLQHSDFAGVIFAREKVDGTFPLEFIRLNTADAPDVIAALRWNPKPNRFGVAGQIISDSSHGTSTASHASLRIRRSQHFDRRRSSLPARDDE